jgi:hypothetical protein
MRDARNVRCFFYRVTCDSKCSSPRAEHKNMTRSFGHDQRLQDLHDSKDKEFVTMSNSRLQLSLSAKGLTNLAGLLNKSDPFAVVTVRGDSPDNPPVIVGQTEVYVFVLHAFSSQWRQRPARSTVPMSL